jgi:hypothetical protein
MTAVYQLRPCLTCGREFRMRALKSGFWLTPKHRCRTGAMLAAGEDERIA